jgi:hypothetical protein
VSREATMESVATTGRGAHTVFREIEGKPKDEDR